MTNDLWTYLASSSKPIVMYGMGNGADKILKVCDRKGIEIKDFFASDGFVRGQLFHGSRVMSFSEVREKYNRETCVILLAFGSANPRTEERFDEGTYTTYYGVALAAVRVNGNTTVTVTDGKETTKATISVAE